VRPNSFKLIALSRTIRLSSHTATMEWLLRNFLHVRRYEQLSLSAVPWYGATELSVQKKIAAFSEVSHLH